MEDQKKTIQHRWFEEVWNKGREDAIAEMLSPDMIAHGLVDESGNELRGAESFKSFHRSFRGAFPDIQVIVEDAVSEGDKTVARCTVRATHTGEGIGLAPTNKPIEINGLCMTRVEDGRIAESWNEFDFMTLYQQIGVLPAIEIPKADSLLEGSSRMAAQFIDSMPAAFREGDASVEGKREESGNVSLVERVFRNIAGGNFDSLGDILAEDVTLEIIGPPSGPFSGRYQGRNQVIETARQNFSQVEAQRPEILSVIAQGDTVVVVGRESGKFRPTGREYELHWMHQYTFRDGKLMHIRELFDSASVLHLAEPEYEGESTPEENKAMMRRWFEEVWDQGREDAVDEMFASDGIAYGLAGGGGEPVYGPAGFKAHYRSVRAAFPDITITVEDTVADNDKIAARCLVRGTHTGEGLGIAATHKPVEITGLLISRIKGGKTVECWNNFNLLSLYQQIGAVSDFHA